MCALPVRSACPRILGRDFKALARASRDFSRSAAPSRECGPRLALNNLYIRRRGWSHRVEFSFYNVIRTLGYTRGAWNKFRQISPVILLNWETVSFVRDRNGTRGGSREGMPIVPECKIRFIRALASIQAEISPCQIHTHTHTHTQRERERERDRPECLEICERCNEKRNRGTGRLRLARFPTRGGLASPASNRLSNKTCTAGSGDREAGWMLDAEAGPGKGKAGGSEGEVFRVSGIRTCVARESSSGRHHIEYK